MNYWLISLPRLDIEHCIKIGTFGQGRKQGISHVMKGDRVVCCAGKGEWKLIAAGEVTSDYYVDDREVFLKPGFYPDRFDFTATKFQEEVDLKSLIEQLSFITNPDYWPVYFKTGMAKLSPDDWKLIEQIKNGKKTLDCLEGRL